MNLKLIWPLLLLSPVLALSQKDYSQRCANVEKSHSLQLRQICRKQAKSLKLTTFDQRKVAPVQKNKKIPTSSSQPVSEKTAKAPHVSQHIASTPIAKRTTRKESVLQGTYLTYKPYVPGAYTTTNSQEKDDES